MPKYCIRSFLQDIEPLLENLDTSVACGEDE